MNLTALNDEQQAQLQAWRAIALDEMPYFARILFACRVVNAPGLGTWAVDKHYRMYIDFEAVQANHTFRWNVESVMHEASHLFADHATSAEDLGIKADTAKVWNAAADLSINDDLDEVGCHTFRSDKMLPEFIGEANGETPHHYFGVLQKKMAAQPQQPKCGTCNQPQPGQGQPTPGQGAPGAGGQPSQQGQPSPGQGSPGQGGQPGNQPGQGGGPGDCGECGQQPGPFKGCGSGSGGQSWAGELDPSDDLGGAAPAVGAVEKEAIRISTAAAMKDYVAKGRGTVPGGMLAIADKILEPSKTPWQQLLAASIKRSIARKNGNFDVDHNRRNRRRHNATMATPNGRRKVVVPGYYTPTPNIEVIRDTSGSMGGMDLAVVGREIEAIARKIGVRGDGLVVTDVDAAVHGSVKYRGHKSIAEVKGRGGTSMTVGIEAAWARKVRPSVIVVVTDGGTDWPEAPGPVPVIAAIVPQGHAQTAEQWAETVPDFIKVIVVDAAEGA